MNNGVMLLAASAGVLFGAVAFARQEISPVPRAGTGVVTVAGTVDIGRIPDIGARQSGDWLVHIGRMPAVSMAGPPFVRSGGRYAITWADGQEESVTVAEPGDGGWIRAEHPGGAPRWLNLATARAVQEVR